MRQQAGQRRGSGKVPRPRVPTSNSMTLNARSQLDSSRHGSLTSSAGPSPSVHRQRWAWDADWQASDWGGPGRE